MSNYIVRNTSLKAFLVSELHIPFYSIPYKLLTHLRTSVFDSIYRCFVTIVIPRHSNSCNSDYKKHVKSQFQQKNAIAWRSLSSFSYRFVIRFFCIPPRCHYSNTKLSTSILPPNNMPWLWYALIFLVENQNPQVLFSLGTIQINIHFQYYVKNYHDNI